MSPPTEAQLRTAGVQIIHNKKSTTYRVAFGPKNARDSRTFRDDPATALEFADIIRFKKLDGSLQELARGKMTLREFYPSWRADAEARHSARTQAKLKSVWNVHLASSALADLSLKAITPGEVQDFATTMARADVGPEARRTALVLLQAILRHAELRGEVTRNAAQPVRKPSGKRRRGVTAAAPSMVEAARARLIDDDRYGSATLLVLMAYAGLRPQEALALTWGKVGQTLEVSAKNVDGEIVDGLKVDGKPPRFVTLLAPLAADLREWRLRDGRPGDRDLIIANAAGEPWADHDYRNWRKRVFQPLATATGLGQRPYDLRHSFASLLLQGQKVSHFEIATQLGHAMTMLHDNYGHVIAELAGKSVDPAAAILAARGAAATGTDG